jgi:lipopolysaccharide export system permease protein
MSEKINKMLENKIPFLDTLYYYNFTIYFANSLFRYFYFYRYFFTSKTNDTEIIAIIFWLRLRPYIIGASIVSVFVLLMGFFVVQKPVLQ